MRASGADLGKVASSLSDSRATSLHCASSPSLYMIRLGALGFSAGPVFFRVSFWLGWGFLEVALLRRSIYGHDVEHQVSYLKRSIPWGTLSRVS